MSATSKSRAPKIRALAPWFGANRMEPEAVGAELGKLRWCGIGCSGSMPELPHIQTTAGVATDLHRHVINLARVVSDPDLLRTLTSRLEPLLFHPDTLLTCQRRCVQREASVARSMYAKAQPLPDTPDVDWAADYVVACWMGRGGHAGKKTEFSQGLAARMTSSGGGSAKRFRSFVESLPAWHQALRRWEFLCVDVFSFLDRMADVQGHGLYLDPPWPELGQEYRHGFTDSQQERIAGIVSEYKRVRVVLRFGDHPLIRRLYPEDRWRWVRRTTTNQTGNEVSEVLIVNGGAR